jgi:methyl-accepting chemotaxis protein
VTAAANNVGTAARQVMDAAAGLSSQSEKLKSEVNDFLSSIRAA